MSYHWTDNTYTPITVDGQLGPATIKALQYGLGDVAVDGLWGPKTAAAFQVFLGVTADGDFGPISTEALQRKLNTVGDYGLSVDGVLGPLTTRALQQCLNAGQFGSGSQPRPPSGGHAAPISESAVQYIRGQSVSSRATVVQRACAAAGLTYSPSWQVGYDTLCTRESSWNPNAVNDSDSNAYGPTQSDGYPQNCSRGLAQCIPPTFAEHHAAGTSDNIYDPVANVAASMLYVVAKYGVSKDGSNLATQVQQANPNRPPKGY